MVKKTLVGLSIAAEFGLPVAGKLLHCRGRQGSLWVIDVAENDGHGRCVRAERAQAVGMCGQRPVHDQKTEMMYGLGAGVPACFLPVSSPP